MSLLWFRRSRRSDAKAPDTPPPAVTPPAPESQPRLPLRIRNLLLVNLQPADGVEKLEGAPPLGSRASVIEKIRQALPGAAFEANRAAAGQDGNRVALDFGPHDPVHAIVAEAEGDSGVDMLRALLTQTRWRAYAPRAGVFVNAESLDLFALPTGPDRA